MKKPITLTKLQKHVKEQDFKPKKKKQYFMKLIEEVGELSEMIKKDKRLDPQDSKLKAIKGTMEEELADVLYYLIALANVYEIDLGEAFLRKEALKRKNEQRSKAKAEEDIPE
jgi:NTP pyrophosphatase (non-canonical NTP hydrolase)